MFSLALHDREDRKGSKAIHREARLTTKALADEPTVVDVRGPFASIGSFETKYQQQGAQRELDALTASRTAFEALTAAVDEALERSRVPGTSYEELRGHPSIRRHNEIERDRLMWLRGKPRDDERSWVEGQVKDMMDDLSDFTERRAPRVDPAPAPGAAAHAGLAYARPTGQAGSWTLSGPQEKVLGLKRRFWSAPTRNAMYDVADEIRRLWHLLMARQEAECRHDDLLPPGLESTPKKQAAASLILTALSRGPQPWTDVVNAGMLAGSSRRTLRAARDLLQNEGKVQQCRITSSSGRLVHAWETVA